MKRKSKKNYFNYPIPHVYDLFGNVQISQNDVIQWVEHVARLPANSPRFDWYVKNWDVVEKIKRVKLEFITLDNYFLQDAANDSIY